MNISKIIFPVKSRSFKGERWVRISLRTLHLIGITGMAGHIFSNNLTLSGNIYMLITIISGLCFVAIEIWSNGVWLIQLRGLTLYLKLTILSCLFFTSDLEVPIFFSAIIISGFISHAPGDVRYYSIFHRRRIEFLNDI